MANTSQSRVPTSEQKSHLSDMSVDAPEMADSPRPAAVDVDETMTRDYKEAMDQSRILSGDALRQAGYLEPTEEEEVDISWRPDPSGHPRRTF